MANQSKFCDSEDFVMSNTSMSQINQSHIVDNPMANVNFDEIGNGNSLKSSGFSDMMASKAKGDNLGAYGEQMVSY